MPQQFIGPAQAIGDSAEHLQDDAGVTRDEGEKILPRQYRQTRIFDNGRIGRAAMATEHCHLAKEVAMTQRSENQLAPSRVSKREANAPAVDDMTANPVT